MAHDSRKAVAPEDELLEQFKDLIEAVAREVGERSVAPHVAPIERGVERMGLIAERAERRLKEQIDEARRAEIALAAIGEKQTARIDALKQDTERQLREFAQRIAALEKQTTDLTEKLDALHRHLTAPRGLARLFSGRSGS